MKNGQKLNHELGDAQELGWLNLWAPWRYKYFEQPKSDDCFICKAIADEQANDKSNLLLFRANLGVIVLNRYPYSAGHLMVAPLQHCATLEDIDEETAIELLRLTKIATKCLNLAIHPKGYNIGINQGVEAGAGLEDHLHIHIVPRWTGDTNFMSIFSGTRVISEDLDHMYDRLQLVLARTGSRT